MNVKANFSPSRWVAWSILLLGISTLPAEAGAAGKRNQETVAVLTRYDVKDGFEDQLQQALKSYVAHAFAQESNIMAEAYSEQGQPQVFWVMERWSSKSAFEKAGKTQPCKAIDSLSENGLAQEPQRTYVTDLEPLSKAQWRTAEGSTDKPLTIMLFVEARPGTETRFKEVYHEAMPWFRGEPGVINYQLSQFAEDSTRFVTYERFRSEEAFQYHLNFPPIQPVIGYLNTSIKKQPFQSGLHRLAAIRPDR
jgi:quinol monooxygenase YgiN